MFGTEESSSVWLNLSVKDGEWLVKGVPLVKHLFTEDLITKEQFKALSDKKVPLEFNLSRIVQESFEDSLKVKFLGYADLNGQPVNINLSLGQNTVSARYLLTGLLMRKNPFQLISLGLQSVKTGNGNLITKIWVNKPAAKDGIASDDQPETSQEKLELLAQLFPEKIYLIETPVF